MEATYSAFNGELVLAAEGAHLVEHKDCSQNTEGDRCPEESDRHDKLTKNLPLPNGF